MASQHNRLTWHTNLAKFHCCVNRCQLLLLFRPGVLFDTIREVVQIAYIYYITFSTPERVAQYSATS